MQKNGWNLFQFRSFAQRLTALRQDVASLAQSDPTGYKQHPKTKLLASVYRSITVTVPINPADPVFRLGHTLGRQNGNWRRIKKGFAPSALPDFITTTDPSVTLSSQWFPHRDWLADIQVALW